MINEQNKMMVGFDLCYDNSQLTVYSQNNTEPITVSTALGEEQYQISTPKDLFPLVEQRAELGTALLSSYFKQCFEMLPGVKTSQNISIMVTMDTMKGVWARAITAALEMLDIPREQIFLQDHLESFYYYLLNQKKEYWSRRSALFEYKRDEITAYELSIDYHTKPAFVRVEKVSGIYLDAKARGDQNEKQWMKMKDQLFLNQCQNMFQDKIFSSVFLVGKEFDKSWEHTSLQFLCSKRSVFQGQNLFSKGACYGAMEQTGAAMIGDYLFTSPDMIEQNVSMPMMVKGKETYHSLISAGVNWYMANCKFEFILDDTREIKLYTKSLSGEEMLHSIQLPDLPKRPNRATRIRMEAAFISRNKIKIRLKDLGLGDLYPATEKKWESVIEL